MEIAELSEAVERVSQSYAATYGIERDATWFLLKLQEEVGELTQAYLMLAGKARTKGKSPEDLDAAMRQEVADVFCQTLLLARHYDINLEQEVREKWLRWNHEDA